MARFAFVEVGDIGARCVICNEKLHDAKLIVYACENNLPMRTRVYLLMASCIFAFTACYDEPGEAGPYVSVTGSWSLRQASVGYDDEPQNILVDSDAFSYPPRFRWNFTADGHMTYNYPNSGSTSDSLSWGAPIDAGSYAFTPATHTLVVPIDVISTLTTSAIADPATYLVMKQTVDSLVLEERKPEIHPTTGDSATAVYIARFLRAE